MKNKKELTTKEIIEKYEIPDKVIDSIVGDIGAEIDDEIDDMDLSDMENRTLYYRDKFGQKLLQDLLQRKNDKVKKKQ